MFMASFFFISLFSFFRCDFTHGFRYRQLFSFPSFLFVSTFVFFYGLFLRLPSFLLHGSLVSLSYLYFFTHIFLSLSLSFLFFSFPYISPFFFQRSFDHFCKCTLEYITISYFTKYPPFFYYNNYDT